MFVDRVTLKVSAGRGGDGVIAWRREKFVPKGGPAGGDGGKGGSLFLQADPELFSLESYRNRKLIRARNGMPGSGSRCKGRDGEDLVLKVPPGTLVRDLSTQEILFDITDDRGSLCLCAGGRGGLGNSRFRSSTHQAPYRCTEGKPGEEREIELELKLIADVGLVGKPNAGKSTLLSRLAEISVKIAPYPFTTLRPNLGRITFDETSSLLLADIPGLLEGAHRNKGLGIEFLRHVERTSLLLFVIELSPWEEERDPFAEFQMLREELGAYDPKLLEKPFLVVLNKIDQEGSEALISSFRARYPFPPSTLFTVSALEARGLAELKEALHLSQQVCCPLA